MPFFDSSWVTTSIAASNATYAALGATNLLRNNPLAQTGYANIINGIDSAIRAGRASVQLPQPQTAGAIGELNFGDFVNANGTSFIDFYALGTNISGTYQQVTVGVSSNTFNPVVRIIDFNTGQQLLNWDGTNTGNTIVHFIAQPGHTYGVTVESLFAATGLYAIQQVVW